MNSDQPPERIGSDKPPVPPDGYMVEMSDQSLRITIVDKNRNLSFLFFFILFCVFILLGTIYIPENKMGGVAFVLTGLAGIYYCLVKLINHTTIDVTSSTLIVRSGPLPTFRGRNWDSTQIVELSTSKKVYSSDHFDYQVNAKFKNGISLDLLGGLEHSGEAKFLEQQIGEWLGIRL